MRAMDKINKVIESDFSSYRISKDSGVAVSAVVELRQGKRQVKQLRMMTADKLEKFYDDNF